MSGPDRDEKPDPQRDALRRKAMERLRARRKKHVPAQDAQTLIHELEVHQVELEVQNEELRRTQSALAEARDRYQDLYEFAPVGYLTLDEHGVVGSANLAAARFCGLDRGKMVGKRMERLVAPEHRDACYLHLRDAPTNVDGHLCELAIPRPDGSTVHVQLEAIAGEDEHGQLSGYRVTMTDITLRKEAIESLLTEQVRLQLALEGGRIGLWDWNLQAGTVYWSDTLYRLLGRDPDRPVTAATFFEYIHQEDRPRVEQHVKEWQSGGNGAIFRDEFRIVREDGGERWLASQGRLYEDSRGRPWRCVGVNYDTTERRSAEEARQHSADRYRLLAETMLQGVVYQDAEGTITAMNPAAERILGRTQESFLGSSSVEEEHRTIREDGSEFPGMEHPSMVALRTGRPQHGVVMGVYNPKKEQRRWIRIDAVPLFQPNREGPAEVYTVFEDITERKKAEEELLQRYEELQRFNTVAVGRELRMIELKKEINDLCGELGRPKRYHMDSVEEEP